MRHSAVEKKVAMIIRWLERLNKSYSDGAIESALMEAECARADLETLRNDVWQKVKPCEHKSSGVIIRILKCLSLAAIVILFYVGPVAKDNVPVLSVKEEIKALTHSQPKPIIIVREYENENEKDEKDEKTDAKVTRVKSSQKTSRRQVTQRKTDNKPAYKAVTRQASQKTVPYDKVLSLVQTGQRALKENTSVISIKK